MSRAVSAPSLPDPMPELAEVEYYRKAWDPGLGHRIQRVHLHPGSRLFREASPALIRRRLTGARLVESFAHGKNLLFHFSGDGWLGGHLGMTGELRAEPPGYAPGRHDHLALFTGATALVFTDPRMFGRIRFEVSAQGPPPWWRELPPGVLSEGFTRERISRFLSRHRRTPVKTALLDQRLFPGIGNWMADEICWRLRWHPGRPAADLGAPEVAALRRMVRAVARDALRVIGDGWKTPPDAWLFNHRWDRDHACPRKGCGATLVREDLRGRTTCWCPRCQPDPVPGRGEKLAEGGEKVS